jgi:outer membrane protein assembly factor BamB
VYVTSADHGIYALDQATGATKWIFVTQNIVNSSPLVGSDGTVYAASYDGALYALNGATGTKKWSFITGSGELRADPAMNNDGVVFVGSEFGVLYAIQASGGLARTPWPKFRAGPDNIGRPLAFSNNQPRLVAVGVSETGFALSGEAPAGQTYSLQASEDLLTWTNLMSITGKFELKDGQIAGLPRRFYRPHLQSQTTP